MWLFHISAWVGKIYSGLTGQQLEGKAVLIKLTDPADRSLEGTVVQGNIYSLPVEAFTRGPEGTEGKTRHGPGTLIIELTEESTISSMGTRWCLAIPRWEGHSAYRLFIAPIVGTLAKIDAPSPSPVSSYEHIVAIAIIKLKKKK